MYYFTPGTAECALINTCIYYSQNFLPKNQNFISSQFITTCTSTSNED